MSQPLRSARITRASALLRAGPPARAATVLSTSPFQRLGALPLALAPRAQCQRAPSRVSAREPQTGLAPPARRAPPGQQYGHSARLIPGRALSPRFRCRLLISTLQRWFTRVRLPGPRLTALTPPFPHRSAPQSSARAPCGGLTPPPAGRRRRATKPSSRVQQASVIASYRGRLLSAHTAQNATKLSAMHGTPGCRVPADGRLLRPPGVMIAVILFFTELLRPMQQQKFRDHAAALMRW
jgi:hypothetical protein